LEDKEITQLESISRKDELASKAKQKMTRRIQNDPS